LLELLRIDPAALDRAILALPANRSLEAHELELTLRLNACTDGKYAAELTHYLTRLRPALRHSIDIDPSSRAVLEERHAADVEWINRTFFDGAPTLRCLPADSDASANDPSHATLRHELDEDFIDWCLEKFGAEHRDSVDFVTSRLKSIDWANARHAAIPKEFDPVAYLLLNKDLLHSQQRPFMHFIRHGQFEHRRMSW